MAIRGLNICSFGSPLAGIKILGLRLGSGSAQLSSGSGSALLGSALLGSALLGSDLLGSD